ncbi:MAG TPA: 4Fe-4S dicluster domain-containing protein, partial [Micromonosporaceae bacterium]|nr:4Fe-4S dicluster domain-containing protein [Micromonosporaceae bacterium]
TVMAEELSSLEPLVAALQEAGYTVIGPTVRDGAIVLAEVESAEDLPYGVGVDVAPGSYRLRRRDDRMAFGHSTGPQSAKSFLHPARSLLFSATRDADADVTIGEPSAPPPRYAFLGLRACDLRAVDIQQRVLGRADTSAYARARAAAFIVAANCTEPASTCFCVSAGGGPRAESGFDLALTELVDGDRVRFLVESGSPQGEQILAGLPTRPASEDFAAQAYAAVEDAATRMGRALPDVDLHELMAVSREAPRWDDVASRCLACGNCTMVCPTCFCTTVTDTTDVTGDHAQRWQTWDSCFDLDFSYLHGGPVRSSVRGRYRQWLSHKVGTWHDQFGETGCVGCGRCIAWCPVGIDITEETNALALAAQLGAPATPAQA